jgi:predicted component of type VI protein secretion system
MAVPGRAEAAAVADQLFDEPFRFDFFQAVRVLEALRPAAAPAGEGAQPADEAVRFRATPGLAFAGGDVAAVAPGRAGGAPEMTVAFMGLAGVGGPLPLPFSELVIRQPWRGEGAPPARDFLDLFHHRLVSLMYRARARNRVSLSLRAADETAAGRWLFALIGLGTAGLRGRQPERAPSARPPAAADAGAGAPSTRPLAGSDAGAGAQPIRPLGGLDADAGAPSTRPLAGGDGQAYAPTTRPPTDASTEAREREGFDRALLGYAALFAGEQRSAAGLECVLRTHFGVEARVVPFTGRWIELEEEDWTRIGRTGRNRTLGQDVVLGRRAWDPQAAFEVELGPLSLAEYVRLLPTGSGFAPLCALVRFWVGVEPAFTVRLVLRAGEVPPARVGSRAGARLGWTSWLRTRPWGPGDAAARLDPALLAEGAG